MTASSYPCDMRTTSSTERSSGGASISLLPGTHAAGWASQVGYQKERISRRAWYRDPAPPSNPSNDGGLRNRVFFILTSLRDGALGAAPPLSSTGRYSS